MWPYWLLYLLPALAAFTQPTYPWAMTPVRGIRDLRGNWILVAIAMTLVVGLRDDVGGDWGNYVSHAENIIGLSFGDVIDRSEPGYWLITWISYDTSWGVHLTNLIFAAFFCLGLIVFCRAQPRPWLALAVSVPYLVIVLGMGYTRQGVALGLAMLGLVALAQQKTLAFVIWVALGALFHKSAVLLIPLGILATPRNKLWTTLWVGLAAVALYDSVLRDSVDAMRENYIDARYQSEGALVRVLMNVLPAVILLKYRKKFRWAPAERNLWTSMALLALASVVWLLLSPSSTAVDRVALYLIPLQLYVFTRIPDVMAKSSKDKRRLVGGVLAYYAIVELVWLIFATHAQYWIPYKFYPLQGGL